MGLRGRFVSREGERASSMVASFSPPVPPSSWRPTTRTLGALFAGSAVMFAFTALNGDSLLLAGGEAGPITEPVARSPTGTGQGTLAARPPAPVSGPGQAAPWTPGAAPQWGSSLGDLPVLRAPVQEVPQRNPMEATSAEVASIEPSASGSSAAGPAAPRRPAGGASAGNVGFDKSAPQTADPRHAGPFNRVLDGVFHVAAGLSD
jgi:hypothetical protein